jgi:hypothetical protein
LIQQEYERKDTNLKACLFCDAHCCGRDALFDHMREVHSMHVGHPDNLVYTDELLKLLRLQLNRYPLFEDQFIPETAMPVL